MHNVNIIHVYRDRGRGPKYNYQNRPGPRRRRVVADYRCFIAESSVDTRAYHTIISPLESTGRIFELSVDIIIQRYIRNVSGG